jgi:gluconokinase
MTSLANPPMIVMGVSGCGKSTVGKMLAQELGTTFIDDADLHSVSNKEKMAADHPLDASDREPWAAAIGEALHESTESNTPAVIACSALKRRYRDLPRAHEPATIFLHLSGAAELIQHRLDDRSHECMPSNLLVSQLSTLEAIEEDEYAIEVDVSQSPEGIVDIVAKILNNR